jgi:hypothetical protein
VDGVSTFERLLALYRQSDLSEERRTVLRVLGTADDPVLLRRAMEYVHKDKDTQVHSHSDTSSTHTPHAHTCAF